MRRELEPCSLPTDSDLLSQTTDNPLSRISPGELKQTHLGWRKKTKSAEQNYIETYWQDTSPTEVWL